MKSRMKKWFCVCLALLVFGIASLEAVSEETIDLSRYSDEEIISLVGLLGGELVDRGIEKTADLRAGRYVGGKDIPAGAYTLICKTDDSHSGIVWLSAAADDLENDYPSLLYEFVGRDQEETYYIEVEEGAILNLPFSAKLQISAGVVFK